MPRPLVDLIILDDPLGPNDPPNRDGLLKWFEGSPRWTGKGFASLDLGRGEFSVHHFPDDTAPRAIFDRNLYGADQVQPVVFEERRRPSHKLTPLERMQQGQQARRALALKVR